MQENIVDNNKIDFVISIDELKKEYIERINIVGNNVTREEVFRNALIIDEGDTFNDPYYSDGIKIDEIMKEVGEQAPSIKKASGGIARMLGE